MFITLSIYSKNLNSLTNFLKFLYKLKINKTIKLRFFIAQSQKKKIFSFFSVLQSPHVNKKSQEQFEYYVHNKQLKIHVSKLIRFLMVWKIVKTKLFFDVKIKTKISLNNQSFKFTSLDMLDPDKFISKIPQPRQSDFISPKIIAFILKFLASHDMVLLKRKLHLSNKAKQGFLRILDIHGEVLLKEKTALFFNGFKTTNNEGNDDCPWSTFGITEDNDFPCPTPTNTEDNDCPCPIN